MISFRIKTTKHLDIRRDMNKFSPVVCCIDKRQKKFHRMTKRENLCFQYRLCPPLSATQCLLMDLCLRKTSLLFNKGRFKIPLRLGWTDLLTDTAA